MNSTGNGLFYSTLIGGGGDVELNPIAIDSQKNCYVAEYARQDYSGSYPLKEAYFDACQGETDVVVTKLNATGTGIIYSSYYGGSSYDVGYGLTVDAFGNCYIIGHTWSPDFPTANAYDDEISGTRDVFLVKLAVDQNDPVILLQTPLNGSRINAHTNLNFTIYDQEQLDKVTYNWDNGPNSTLEAPYILSLIHI